MKWKKKKKPSIEWDEKGLIKYWWRIRSGNMNIKLHVEWKRLEIKRLFSRNQPSLWIQAYNYGPQKKLNASSFSAVWASWAHNAQKQECIIVFCLYFAHGRVLCTSLQGMKMCPSGCNEIRLASEGDVWNKLFPSVYDGRTIFSCNLRSTVHSDQCHCHGGTQKNSRWSHLWGRSGCAPQQEKISLGWLPSIYKTSLAILVISSSPSSENFGSFVL